MLVKEVEVEPFRFECSSKSVLIDADSMLYLSVPNKEEQSSLESLPDDDRIFEALKISQSKFEALYASIVDVCNSSKEPTMFFSCNRSTNYRLAFYSNYKVSREKSKSKRSEIVSLSLLGLKNHVLNNYKKAIICLNCEADDAIAYTKRLIPDESIICSIDKDVLYQLPGIHFNYAKNEKIETSEAEALKFLCMQGLMGDSVDSIPGIPKIGRKKAKTLLDNLGYSIDSVRQIYQESKNPNFSINMKLVDINLVDDIEFLDFQKALVATKLSTRYDTNTN